MIQSRFILILFIFEFLSLVSLKTWAQVSCEGFVDRASNVRGLMPLKEDGSNFSNFVEYVVHPETGITVPYVSLPPLGKSKGISVVLFAGFSKNMRFWIESINQFRSRGYRVVSFDQTNVGENLRINDRIESEPEVDAALGNFIIEHLGLRNYFLIGHSRGGLVAALSSRSLVAQNAPEFRGLFLASPFIQYLESWTARGKFGGIGATWDLWFGLARANTPGLIGLAISKSFKELSHEQTPELREATRQLGLGYILKGLSGSQLDKPLEEIAGKVPVRLQVGTEDGDLVPLHLVEGLQERFGQNMQFVTMEGKDHFWLTQDTAYFVSEFESFMKASSSRN